MSESSFVYITSSTVDDKRITYHKWSSLMVKTDLIEAGLNPWLLDFNTSQIQHSYLAVYKGTYNGNNFQMRWMKNQYSHYLVLRSHRPSPELRQAFTRILELKPFNFYKFKDEYYNDELSYTYEWDKINKGKRFSKLLEDKERRKFLRWLKD